MDVSLRIVSWNIHGNLPIKIRYAEVIELVVENDVILLQETWLCCEQERTLVGNSRNAV